MSHNPYNDHIISHNLYMRLWVTHYLDVLEERGSLPNCTSVSGPCAFYEPEPHQAFNGKPPYCYLMDCSIERKQCEEYDFYKKLIEVL